MLDAPFSFTLLVSATGCEITSFRRHGIFFDRMLIAQALMGGLVIVTSDSAFQPYPVRVLW